MIESQKTVQDFKDGMSQARKNLEQYSLANPENFQDIENACNQWLGDVEGLEKTAENRKQRKIIQNIWAEVQRIAPLFHHFSDWVLARANKALKEMDPEGEFSSDGKNKIKTRFSTFSNQVLLLSADAWVAFGAKIEKMVSEVLVSSHRHFCCFSCGDKNNYTVKKFPEIDEPNFIEQIEKEHGKIPDIQERFAKADDKNPPTPDESLALGEFGDDEKSSLSTEESPLD